MDAYEAERLVSVHNLHENLLAVNLLDERDRQFGEDHRAKGIRIGSMGTEIMVVSHQLQAVGDFHAAHVHVLLQAEHHGLFLAQEVEESQRIAVLGSRLKAVATEVVEVVAHEGHHTGMFLNGRHRGGAANLEEEAHKGEAGGDPGSMQPHQQRDALSEVPCR